MGGCGKLDRLFPQALLRISVEGTSPHQTTHHFGNTEEAAEAEEAKEKWPADEICFKRSCIRGSLKTRSLHSVLLPPIDGAGDQEVASGGEGSDQEGWRTSK